MSALHRSPLIIKERAGSDVHFVAVNVESGGWRRGDKQNLFNGRKRNIYILFLLGLVIAVWCGNIEIGMGSCFDHTGISSAHQSYSNPLGLVNESH